MWTPPHTHTHTQLINKKNIILKSFKVFSSWFYTRNLLVVDNELCKNKHIFQAWREAMSRLQQTNSNGSPEQQEEKCFLFLTPTWYRGSACFLSPAGGKLIVHNERTRDDLIKEWSDPQQEPVGGLKRRGKCLQSAAFRTEQWKKWEGAQWRRKLGDPPDSKLCKKMWLLLV